MIELPETYVLAEQVNKTLVGKTSRTQQLTTIPTEADSGLNRDYYCHCYKDGDFCWGTTLDEFVEENLSFWHEDGDKSDDEACTRIMEVFPKLKRWAK